MFVQALVLLCVTLVRQEWRDSTLVNPSWCLSGVCLKLFWRLFPLLTAFSWAVKSNGHGRCFSSLLGSVLSFLSLCSPH